MQLQPLHLFAHVRHDLVDSAARWRRGLLIESRWWVRGRRGAARRLLLLLWRRRHRCCHVMLLLRVRRGAADD